MSPLIPHDEGSTLLARALARDHRRVVIFDDDPTGTQTVSDVDVILHASTDAVERMFASGDRVCFVSTNTRSLPEPAAVATLREAHARVEAAAARAGVAWTAVLRGDSTLRGHVFAEIDAVAEAGSVTLFAPAFLEGGRVTSGGQQLLTVDGVQRNVADTEFARDTTFGYRSRDLVAWVAEVGNGRLARMVPLDAIRAHGAASVTAALLEAPEGSVVIPEAEVLADVALAVLGLLAAEKAGRRIMVRAASTFAAVRAGLTPRAIERVQLSAPGRILIVCGSHTLASRRQLMRLEAQGRRVETLHPDMDVAAVIDDLRRGLDADRVAIVASPPDVRPGTNLVTGATFVGALAKCASVLAGEVEAVVAKGGITSAEIARALGARVARVEGQLAPGIALWQLERPAGRLPYVVVPGNVGEADTLVRILGQLGSQPPTAAMMKRNSNAAT